MSHNRIALVQSIAIAVLSLFAMLGGGRLITWAAEKWWAHRIIRDLQRQREERKRAHR